MKVYRVYDDSRSKVSLSLFASREKAEEFVNEINRSQKEKSIRQQWVRNSVEADYRNADHPSLVSYDPSELEKNPSEIQKVIKELEEYHSKDLKYDIEIMKIQIKEVVNTGIYDKIPITDEDIANFSEDSYYKKNYGIEEIELDTSE